MESLNFKLTNSDHLSIVRTPVILLKAALIVNRKFEDFSCVEDYLLYLKKYPVYNYSYNFGASIEVIPNNPKVIYLFRLKALAIKLQHFIHSSRRYEIIKGMTSRDYLSEVWYMDKYFLNPSNLGTTKVNKSNFRFVEKETANKILYPEVYLKEGLIPDKEKLKKLVYENI